MNYLKAIFSYLFSNLNRQVVAIACNGFSSFYLFLIFFSRIACIVRWFIRMLAIYVDLSFYFEFDILNKRNPVKKSSENQQLTFIYIVYYIFFLRFTILLYLNSTDKLVWSHLYDLVHRNQKQVSLQEWRSVNQWWSILSNSIRKKNKRIFHQKPFWYIQLKNLIFFPRLKIHRSAKLFFYPHLEEKLRINCVLICYFFEALMVLIYAYYLVLLLYFDLGYSLRKLRKLPTTIVQWTVAAAVYLVNLQTAYYTYASLLLVEMVIILVCHLYVVQYRILNDDLEKAKSALKLKINVARFQQPSTLLPNSLNCFTAAYRTGHTRLTVFLLRFNQCLVSKVIAYFLHYFLPYHSCSVVNSYFKMKRQSLLMAFTNNWYLVLTWLFLLVITLVVARTNSAITRSAKTLSALFAQKGLVMAKFGPSRRQSNYYHSVTQTTEVGGLREALKLAAYFEMIWREEKQLAFTAGQTYTAMSWRFIYEIVILYSSCVLYFASKLMEQDSSGT